jgi:membrane-anchored protein YejM (alkaline phosphatase superfamily)
MSARRPLLRWIGWFAAANAALFALVSLRFLASYPFTGDALGAVYGVLAWIGHFALLGALPAGLLLVPLAALLPRRAPVTAAAVIVYGLVLALLVVDTNVFAEQRYHITPLTAVLFEPATWAFVALIGVFALVFEALLAGYVRRWVEGAPARGGRALAAALALAWLASQGIHMWADAIGHTPVTQLTRYLPAYFPIHAKRTLARWGLVDPAVAERQRLLRKAGAAAAGQLAYPLRPLDCEAPAERPNLLVVLVDALRPDAIDPALTPTLAAFRAGGSDFARHWSGGNSSRAGIFSMFYGLPSTYLEAFYGVQQPPVLLTRLQAEGYDLGLFAAPGFSTPADIGRTVFAGVPGLPGERRDLGAVARNRAVTDDWLGWLGRHDATRPFFGFLYYDPPMGEVGAAPGEALPMEERFTSNPEAREAWRSYRLAMRMADAEVARVLADLGARGLLERTVVVVASDHGYEFDDNGLGYIGHASSFGPAQVRATLMIRWPGRASARYTHRTSHYDLPVTLLQDALGCRGDPADYALGRNLYAGVDWPWIIVGSYNAHAILDPERVIVTHPGGFVEVRGADYRPVADTTLDARVVAEAMGAMRRFYR